MTAGASSSLEVWPSLPLEAWSDTCATRMFQIDFDFINHELTVQSTDGGAGGFELASQSVRQIDALRTGSEIVVVMWNRDAVPVWRKVSYYYSTERVYELVGRRTDHPRARLWQGNRMLSDASLSPQAKISVPKGARLIWLVHPVRGTGPGPQRASPGGLPCLLHRSAQGFASVPLGQLRVRP